jgi:hypothetical protein
MKGAFLKAKVPEDLELVVKMDGREVAELMVNLSENMLLDDQGVIYLNCKKALCRHIESARLFYDDLHDNLIKLGFVRNNYDACVLNKKEEQGTITVMTHVNDLKVS